MKKNYIILIIIGVILITSLIVGFIIINKPSKIELTSEKTLSEHNENKKNEIEIITTSNIEQKTSPNCMFVFKTYYRECEHTLINKIDIPKEFVNQTVEEIEREYLDWKIQSFNVNEVIFYQEKEGICEEHFIVKENNGYITIYFIDKYGVEKIKETTEIVTTYLPEIDKNRLKEGIKINGQEELNACLEDYE
ncbi:MAG: hypothetical protein GX682_03330 [Clostridiaceae bacterium]|nr:hypothetical protein [Clostridiaceae bacterium]